jgi:hypothetical protein
VQKKTPRSTGFGVQLDVVVFQIFAAQLCAAHIFVAQSAAAVNE